MLVQWIKHSAENITVKLDQTHFKKGVDFGMYPLGKKNLHFITLMYCVFLRAYILCITVPLKWPCYCACIYYHIYIYSYINSKLLHERKSSICEADSVEDELHIKLFMLYNQLSMFHDLFENDQYHTFYSILFSLMFIFPTCNLPNIKESFGNFSESVCPLDLKIFNCHN